MSGNRDLKRAAERTVDHLVDRSDLPAERLSITYGPIATADLTGTAGHILADRIADDTEALTHMIRPLLQTLTSATVQLDAPARDATAALVQLITRAARSLLALADQLHPEFTEACGADDGQLAIDRLAALRSDLDHLEDLLLPPVTISVSLPPQRAAALDTQGGRPASP
ncbi:hypothetical protein [Kitasatospora sp. LaBMicrA B282]|uniref:hypothetical protein n=1 Tax=Kitasatospora sp. LaBMicrA B282 TaxID=3420949 RepID=UPI003D0FBAF5